MRIAVVIPTRGRRSLTEAVESAAAQSLAPCEIFVVVDNDDTSVVEGLVPFTRPTVRVIATGRRRGGNVARMAGVRASTADYIAFLDDDDVWLPDKLQKQAELLTGHATPHVVVSSRVTLVDEAGRPAHVVWPRRLLGDGERVAEYLFRRREVRHGEGLLHTSTLVCDRSLLSAVPWRANLVRHQDWDWVLDVDRTDVTIRMCPQPLVKVREQGSSVSHARGWADSVEWVLSRREGLTPREVGDFLLAHAGPLALLESRRAALRVAVRAFSSGRPGPPAVAFFVARMVFPARLLTRLARMRPRGRKAEATGTLDVTGADL